MQGLSYFLTSATGCSPPKRLTKKPPAHLVIRQVHFDVTDNKEAKDKGQKYFNRPFSDPPNPRKASPTGETKNGSSHAHSRTLPAGAWADVTTTSPPYYTGTRGRSNTTSQAEQKPKYTPTSNPEQHLHWYRAAELVVGVHPAVYASSLPGTTHQRNPISVPWISQVHHRDAQVLDVDRGNVDSTVTTEEVHPKVKTKRSSRQSCSQYTTTFHTFTPGPDANATSDMASPPTSRRRPAPILALKDTTNRPESSKPHIYDFGRPSKSSTRTNHYPKGKENRPVMPVY
ncbi:hypothetical protein BDN72DRAFT_844778 [Pluteus cervinus]|uniref:Uncharacterized protein n=1 Tax=Pluteus cervinus TaxID=181527 RepID=A0ACD3AJY5_9AGAR|nr:hypothetical protein BDN72DRAFT_844778 [Pluteus cervinus]